MASLARMSCAKYMKTSLQEQQRLHVVSLEDKWKFVHNVVPSLFNIGLSIALSLALHHFRAPMERSIRCWECSEEDGPQGPVGIAHWKVMLTQSVNLYFQCPGVRSYQ